MHTTVMLNTLASAYNVIYCFRIIMTKVMYKLEMEKRKRE